ncbi:MAG: TetR/AcrR family transcriptional regulator, partial [Clostridiales bacterium]|nr:TetR/AcrR family transcriptional regulator [Clostridiales bacterium]
MDKKHEILKAAFDIFCEKGYHLSVSELAGAVSIKTPSLYSHFASKDEIIELVIRDEIQRYYSCLTAKMLEVSSLSCKEAMKSLYGYVIDYFSKDKRLRFWRAVPFIQNQQLKSISTQLIVDNDRNFKQQMEQC